MYCAWNCKLFQFVQGKWLPRLQDLVTRINETFGRNFAEMAVAGEVRLGEFDARSDGGALCCV